MRSKQKESKAFCCKVSFRGRWLEKYFLRVITQVNIGQVDWGPEFWKSACRPTNHSRSCNWGKLRVKIDFITTIHESMSSLKVLSPYDDGIQGNPVGLLQVCHIFIQFFTLLKLKMVSRSSVCQDGGLRPPMISATRKVNWKLDNIMAAKIIQWVVICWIEQYGNFPFFRLAPWEKLHHKVHHWRETHRGEIVIHDGFIKLFQVGAGKSKKLAKRQAANKMIQVWFPLQKKSKYRNTWIFRDCETPLWKMRTLFSTLTMICLLR